MSDVRFYVNRYLGEGWSPIPIPAGEKGPRIPGWEQKSFDAHDFAEDDNIGVHLGRTGLYDVDLDDKFAAIAADILLAPTARISGRPGKPRSHRFYTCSENIEHVSYHGVGGNSDTLVELRGFSPNGASTQTVVPPSVHPSGETVAWETDGKPTHFETAAPLIAGVRNVALAVLLARAFPGPGHRHGPRLALAGYLHRAGLEDLEVLAIGRAIMRIVGGDEQDWLDTARTTLAKLKDNKDANVTGGPTLKDALSDGEQVLKRCNIWLGRTDQAAVEDVIDRINQHHFILEVGTQVVVGDDEREQIILWPFTEFRKKFGKDFMPGQRTKDKVSKTGVVTPGTWKKGRPCVEVWLEHPRGRKYKQLVYAPPGSRVQVGPQDYNGWKGFAIEPVKGDWPLTAWHLKEIICDGSETLYTWLLNWCAALVQRPGEHAYTAMVLQGGQGTGKGFFAHDLLGGLFDRRHYIHLSSSEQFYGRFAGEALSGKCFVFLDEATWGGDKRDAGTLKDRVTGDTLVVDRKNLPVVTEPSMLHIVIASNEAFPVGLDRDDRRFAAFKVNNQQANDPAYFRPLYRELRKGGQSAFLAAMLAWEIDEEALRRPPLTHSKAELQERNLPPEAEWWLERLNEGRLLDTDKTWPVTVVRSALYNSYIQFMQNLGHGRRLSHNSLGRELRRFYPSLQSERHHAKPREYRFQPLSQVRREFEVYLGHTPRWDDPGHTAVTKPDDF